MFPLHGRIFVIMSNIAKFFIDGGETFGVVAFARKFLFKRYLKIVECFERMEISDRQLISAKSLFATGCTDIILNVLNEIYRTFDEEHMHPSIM